jgi:hypothetical protein
MMYRIRLCNDSLWYVQQKRAPGLAGGIWKRVNPGALTERGARNLLALIGDGRKHV